MVKIPVGVGAPPLNTNSENTPIRAILKWLLKKGVLVISKLTK